MKKTSYFLKLSCIVGLLYAFPFFAIAQIETVAYLCGDVQLTLTPGIEGYTISADDEVMWQEFDDAGEPVGDLIQRSGDNPNLVLSNLDVGKYRYAAYVISEVQCSGDLSDFYEIYQLPESTIALESTLEEYCATGETNADPAVLTATVTPASPLPADVNYEYTWIIKKGTEDIAASEVGTEATGADFSSTFTMTIKDVATYAIRSSAKYTVPEGAFFKSPDQEGCVVTSDTETVNVVEAPEKPVITFS